MSIKKMKKEELELMNNKDISYMILSERVRPISTADLFKKIIDMLELPEETFEKKIAEFYTALSTDKRFILLENGKWDLRNRHTSDKVIKSVEEDDETTDTEDEEEEITNDDQEIEEDNYDDTDDDEYDSTDEDLKDLVIIDEDELELES